MIDIQVRYANETISCPYGTDAQTVLSRLGIAEDALVALRVDNEICPLNTLLAASSTLEPVLAGSPEGAMIYRRSLAFLLAMAARKLFPGQRLYVGHSLGNSYYYTFDRGAPPDGQAISALQGEMEALVRQDIPITFKYLGYEQAIRLFSENLQTDTVQLLEQRGGSRIKVNECGGCLDMYVEPLVPRTGMLSLFQLMPYQEGLLLRFPAVGSTVIEPFNDQPQLFGIYREYKKWGRIVGVRVVADLNSMVANRTIRDHIRIAEIHQERKIAEIAEQIHDQRDGVKLILIAGPSSSGKTTCAKRLSLELMVMGIRPVNISLDSYFVGTEQTPRDENGQPDYECLEALDIAFLNEQLQALYRGEEISLPVYDFKTGSRSNVGGKKIRLDRRMVLIVEGIHALNDALTPGIARDTKFKMYVSALTQLNLDDHNRVPTSDNRILRRLVRDYQFRAKDAARTIKMWSSVQAGERKHIFPFQNTADAVLNSSLDYELSVLKYYADPILRAVKPAQAEHAEASRLLSFLENFAPIPPQYVPGTSILREFIGDSEFKY
ncbi:MAG: nucleoside kinase [Treponema sp.]|jgi:uridine kinase|nr:nucleoside kinase [Treponema sp.]